MHVKQSLLEVPQHILQNESHFSHLDLNYFHSNHLNILKHIYFRRFINIFY